MNAVSWIRLAVVAVVGIVLQVSVFDDIDLLGVHPDLMVVIAAAGGIVAGPARGAMIGFVAGCFADLAVNLPFGMGPLTFVLVGFGSSYLLRAASGRDLPIAELSTVVVSAGAGTILYALIGAGIGQPEMLGSACARAVVIVAVGAAITGLAVLRVVRWVIEPSASSVIGGIGAG
jgi:rod shape-determining protein MreD